MKNVFILVFVILSGLLPAQKKIAIHDSLACSYYGDAFSDSIQLFNSNDEAEEIIKDIIGAIGLKPRFEIRAAKVPNAAAVIYGSKRYVLYNPTFIEQLNKQVGSKWASVSILAHEIGHHLNGHTLDDGGSRPDLELEADEFSGFVLHRLGATLDEAQAAMRVAASIKASHTHPAKADRLKAIAAGWETASGQKTVEKRKSSKKDTDKPVVKENPEKESSVVLADKYIAYDVSFKADPQGKYYVTVRNNLVKVEGNQLYIIGRLGESNLPKYSQMLYDEYYNYLYVKSNGVVVNGSGKKIGAISRHKK